MGKVRLNENREIVARVKEGLKRKEGYCPCRLEIKPEYKCICMNSKHRSRIRILRAIVIVSFIIKRNNCHCRAICR